MINDEFTDVLSVYLAENIYKIFNDYEYKFLNYNERYELIKKILKKYPNDGYVPCEDCDRI